MNHLPIVNEYIVAGFCNSKMSASSGSKVPAFVHDSKVSALFAAVRCQLVRGSEVPAPVGRRKAQSGGPQVSSLFGFPFG